MPKIHLFFTLILGLTLSLQAASAPYPALRDQQDPSLQRGLEAILAVPEFAPTVRQGKLAVALVDVTDLLNPRLASVNGDKMLYAASLPKIAILLGAFVKIERGEMEWDNETREILTQMIRVSSNQAATEMFHRVGERDLAKILQSDRFRLYDPKVNGGLWVGKEYGKSPAWKRDPLHNISHGATALQVARFYYLLETKQLVSPKLNNEMKKTLSKPALHHKFVKGLDAARPGSTIHRKSGSWRKWHADSALVERDGHKYIAVALIEHPKGGKWMSKLILAMDNLIFQSQVAQLN